MDARSLTAEERTALVRRQIKVLDDILVSALSRPPLSFDQLLVSPGEPRFDPGALAVPLPAPAWEDFAPAGRSRLWFGGRGRFIGRGRFGRRAAAARALFQAALAEHEQTENQRRRALAAAKAQHDRVITAERVTAARHNADIERRRTLFASRDPCTIEWFVGQVLHASRYPDVFPRDYDIGYQPRTRAVVVAAELPPRQIVPSARAFRYASSRAAVEPVPRPDTEIRQRYRRLVAAIALRTLHEIFTATPPDVVATITFSGWLTSADPATGQPQRPCLVTVTAARDAFAELVLAAVDPIACLTHLNGELSSAPTPPRTASL